MDLVHNEVTAWLVLALSLLLTAAAWQISTRYVERRAQERFQFEVEDAKFAIIKRMQEYEQTLRGGIAFFNATGRLVTRQEWHSFVTTLKIEEFFPGLQGVGFSLWIPSAEKDAVIARVRSEGYPEFTIKPEGEREVYTSIIYLEPLVGRNLRAFGFDMFSEPTRRAALELARDTGQTSVSGKVTLVQETKQDVQAGFLMYLPVYRRGAPTETVEQRRAALLGFVYSPFRINDLMQGILGQGAPGLDFHIYDGEQVKPAALLFDSSAAWHAEAHDHARTSGFTATETIELPGRTWTVTFASRANFERDMSSSQPQMIAIGGLVVDLLLFAIIWSLSQQRKQVLVQAGKMTVELRRSREQFRAITETAYDAILSTDAAGVVMYCNPAASVVFGLDASKILGMPITALVPDRRQDSARPGLSNLLAQGKTAPVRASLETIGVRAGGSEFPLEISLSSWKADGHVYFTLLIRDISERRKMERLKSEFVSTVSHELRTPLTAIRGALGLLRAGKADVPIPQSAELISIAYQNTERLTHLVNDILDMEKLASGKMTLEMQHVQLPDLLQAAIKENQHYALPHHVALVLEQPVPEVSVWADSNRLMQVLANLISNASKFAPPDTAVRVSATVQGRRVRIAVTDQGPGLPDDFRERVFQRFSQADASDSRQKGGSGLGLSICKSIVELHGGTIDYESTPNKGACFYFYLSLEEPSPVL